MCVCVCMSVSFAGTPGLAPTPGAPTAPTPFLSAPTPGMTPGDGLGATPALLGATPGTAPTPHVNNAYTPHIADTPALPASTPGPEAAMYASGYTQWTGLVVRVMLGADAGQVAVVQRVEGSTLHIVKGTLAGDTGSFLEDPGAVEEAVPGESVELARWVLPCLQRVRGSRVSQYVARPARSWKGGDEGGLRVLNVWAQAGEGQQGPRALRSRQPEGDWRSGLRQGCDPGGVLDCSPVWGCVHCGYGPSWQTGAVACGVRMGNSTPGRSKCLFCPRSCSACVPIPLARVLVRVCSGPFDFL